MRMMDNLLFAGASSFMYPIIGGLIPIMVAMYVIARWRLLRAGQDDPQLGLKTALCFFLLISFQAGLLGLFLFLAALFNDANIEMIRVAGGVLIPSTIVFFAHLVALRRTNHAEMPLLGRMFLGLSLVQTGVLGFASLLFFFVTLLQKDTGDILKYGLAMVAVYCGAWGWQTAVFLKKAPPPAPAAPAQTT